MKYYVEVKRSHPCVESLWYEFDKLEEAVEYAQNVYNLKGVDSTRVTDEKETIIEELKD